MTIWHRRRGVSAQACKRLSSQGPYTSNPTLLNPTTHTIFRRVAGAESPHRAKGRPRRFGVADRGGDGPLRFMPSRRFRRRFRGRWWRRGDLAYRRARQMHSEQAWAVAYCGGCRKVLLGMACSHTAVRTRDRDGPSPVTRSRWAAAVDRARTAPATPCSTAVGAREIVSSASGSTPDPAGRRRGHPPPNPRSASISGCACRRLLETGPRLGRGQTSGSNRASASVPPATPFRGTRGLGPRKKKAVPRLCLGGRPTAPGRAQNALEFTAHAWGIRQPTDGVGVLVKGELRAATGLVRDDSGEASIGGQQLGKTKS